LFSHNTNLEAILHEVGDYQRLGGSIWFGTDVGFLEDYDPALEFALLQRAGLSFDQILAALTTAPAARLPGGNDRGRVKPGMIADLVVLDGDPAEDPKAWTRVRITGPRFSRSAGPPRPGSRCHRYRAM
jgi:imidazolonepropionase-like amidohydrolase